MALSIKASRFNVEVPQPAHGGSLLYNTLCGSLTAWDAEEMVAVRRLLAGSAVGSASDAKIRRCLVAQRHLVPGTKDEIAVLERRKRLGVRDRNRLDVVLMPTLDCNFACSYCYESRRPSSIEPAMAEGISRWLERSIPRFKLTLLHWFGGEPLLAFRQVAATSRRARETAERAGVMVAIHATTNGYLLTPDRARLLVESGLRDFQVTLDGPAETHDRLRTLRGGGGTFARIFENLVSVAREHLEVTFTLRVNFNHTNLHAIPELLEMFPVSVRPRLRLVLEPIFGEKSCSATQNLPAGKISAETTRCYRLAAQLGYAVTPEAAGLVPGKLVYCYAEREHQYVVSFNGDVYKCSVCDFRPEERVGRITHGGEFVKEPAEWAKWVSTTDLFGGKCRECVHLPLCMGGCRKARLQSGQTGGYCSLIPTNASQVLKQVALGGFERIVSESLGSERREA